MSRYAEPVRAAPIRKKTPPAATPSHHRGAATGQTIQFRRALGAEAAAPVARPVAKALSRSGLPRSLQVGVERLSGLAMDDVRVHRNSPEPAKLGALAYTKGSDIHLGPGQEQHLPHEAWHVVQQKQGRVQATTQLREVEISEDRGLEAEADRMGAALWASNARSVGGPEVQSRRDSRQVVQMKVNLRGKPLEESKKKASELLKKYIRADEEYILRSDFAGQLDQTPIHLVDCRYYYLIGEKHDNPATWEAAITGWSHVPKMTEYKRTMPKEADDPKGVFVTPGTSKEKPLESTHSHLMAIALLTHDKLNNLKSCFLTTGTGIVIQAKSLLAILRMSIDYLNDLTTTFKFYSRYIKLYNKDDVKKTDRLKKIFEFSELIKNEYRKKVKSFAAMLTSLREVIDSRWLNRKSVIINTNEDIDTKAAKIEQDRQFLVTLASDSLGIVNIADEGEAEAIRALFPSTTPDEEKTFNAVRPARDREMASNVSRTRPPLLIRMGNAHVPGIANAVGSSITVTVPLNGDRLDKKTQVSS